MTNGLFLSLDDNRPMYLQIMEQIKIKVMAGDWPAGHSLPSIRELASASRVSVITVKRAYTELEHEGVIFTRPGKGSFVASGDNLPAIIRDTELKKHIDGLVDVAKKLNLSADELLKHVKDALKR